MIKYERNAQIQQKFVKHIIKKIKKRFKNNSYVIKISFIKKKIVWNIDYIVLNRKENYLKYRKSSENKKKYRFQSDFRDLSQSSELEGV